MTDLAIWATLRAEVGDRVVSDLRAENGPVGEGVVLKRFYFVAKPPHQKTTVNIFNLKEGDEFWSVSNMAFMRFIRWSKKGNAIARRSYGLTGKAEYVLRRSDIEVWDESDGGWTDGEGWCT